MFTYLTVRDQSIFGSYGFTSTQESTSSAGGDVDGNTMAQTSYIEGINGDTSFTISQYSYDNSSSQDFGEGFNAAGGANGAGTYVTSNCLTLLSSSFQYNGFQGETINTETFGTTTYVDSNGDTVASSISGTEQEIGTTGASSESQWSTTAQYIATYQYSTFQTATGTRNVTSNVDTTTSQWTVTGVSGKSWATTESFTTTAVSNYSSSVYDDGTNTFANNYPITQTFESSFLVAFSTSQSFSVLQEVGTVVIADTDWLWSFKTAELPTYNTNYSFLTDIASSFTETTFWPAWETQAVSFASNFYDTQSFSYAVPGTSYSWEFLIATETETITVTSGSFFPRDTYSTTVPVWIISNSSTSIDSTSFEVDAASTQASFLFTDSILNFTAYITYPVGLSDIATTSLHSTSAVNAITSIMVALSAYVGESDGDAVSFGASMEQTTLLQDNLNITPLTAAPLFVEAVPAVGAFLAPQQLKSSANMSFGGNLEFGGDTIYDPFLNTVYPNVLVPAFGTTNSTTASGDGTDIVTFKYNWVSNTEGVTLLYSKIGTVDAGTTTTTSATVSSGQFSTSSTLDDYFVSLPTVFGGYAYNEAPASAYFAPRAVYGTHVSDSSTSTYKTIVTEFTSNTKQGDLIIETSAAAYCAWQGTLGEGDTPYLSFPRNSE